MAGQERLIFIDEGLEPADHMAAEQWAEQAESYIRQSPYAALEVIRDQAEQLTDPYRTTASAPETAAADHYRQQISVSVAHLLFATGHGRYLELADAVYDRLDADEAYQRALADFQRPRPRSFDDNPLRRAVALQKIGMVASMHLDRQAEQPGQGEVA